LAPQKHGGIASVQPPGAVGSPRYRTYSTSGTLASMNGFISQVGSQAFWSVFHAEAGVVASAEGCRVVRSKEVEANTAGVHRFGNLEGPVLIATEHDASEAEFGVIGQADRLV